MQITDHNAVQHELAKQRARDKKQRAYRRRQKRRHPKYGRRSRA